MTSTRHSGENFRFADRRHAGIALARQLQQFANRNDVVVLALPRGGVPVAYHVARSLGAPMDVFVVLRELAPGELSRSERNSEATAALTAATHSPAPNES